MVLTLDHGALIAVVDGIGHGTAAAAAASTAIDLLEGHATDPLVSLVKRCHEGLAGTRGVVMTLATIDYNRHTVTWLGVGNVEGRLMHGGARDGHSTDCVLLRGGVVGYRLPPLNADVLPLAAGDLLVLATDGIRAEFAYGLNLTHTPEQMARQVLNRYYGGTDDALVLVVRYRGELHE